MHVCPQVTVLVPHVGGPILPPCEPTVLIGGLPAARITDMRTCVGPPDVIIMGSPTVLIGNLMAARLGDPTVHGGVIVLGCFTVMIGEAGMGVPPGVSMSLMAIQGFINSANALEAAGNNAAAAAMRQRAIDEAIKHFGIDTSKTKSVTYDPTVSGEAVTSSDAKVRVGDAAFRSPEWLGSSVGHEVEVHVNEQAAKGKWYTGPEGTNIQEVQAYDYEIANAKRYGTSPADVADLEKRRKDYHDGLSPAYQKQVDGSPPSYDLPPGHDHD